MVGHNWTPAEVYAHRMRGRLPKPIRPYTLIDAFCGAGGMSLGFSSQYGHAFKPLWANDHDSACVDTYRANFAIECHLGDIVSFLRSSKHNIPRADVVIGGPPCQAHCPLNRFRDGDPRKQLWRPFLDIVRESHARVFVMENVPELIGRKSFEYGEIVENSRMLGFQTTAWRLCAADFGVPQTRWRAFIVGWREGDPGSFFPPRATHRNPNGQSDRPRYKTEYGFIARTKPWKTVRDAIGDLPAPQGIEIRQCAPPENLHFGRSPTALSLKRFKAIPEEGMNRFDLQRQAPQLTPKCWIKKPSGGTDVFGRLWWDKPAFTIRTEFFKPEKGRYLHPVENRPITHREAARFQSFPDTFVFQGSKIEIAAQIGNAVPPLMAARLADSVYAMLRCNSANK